MSTNELQWMVDVETSTGVVRAELTTDGRLECADRRVLAALDALGTEGETWVRPINSALGMAVVSPDDPESMASFVYSVLLHADPNLGEVTFFGTRCLPEVDEPKASADPDDPNFALDTIDDEAELSSERPESQFGLIWPR